MATAWMIAVFLGLAAVGVPVCASMGIGAFLGLALINAPLDTFPRYELHDVRSVPLLAIPFFILAGNLPFYYMILAVVILSVVASRRLENSRLGRARPTSVTPGRLAISVWIEA